MSVVDSIRKSLVPIHPEGYVFIAAFGVTSLILHWISPTLGWLGFIATAWCVYFFRDPPRVTPLREGLVVSPADGEICSIGFFLPPPELGLGADPMQRVSVFMSVFDCHVNSRADRRPHRQDRLSPRALRQRRSGQGERGQ